ncbi:MAG: helix-hairpin-helix domain-containing protein [Betaproteobacteria bacterium]|nr:helix-hairpin-helix domain-containing protein [Betaproteobacteria bacterium]
MRHRIIETTLIAAALLLCANQSLAADNKPETPGASAGSASEKGASAHKPAAPAKNQAAAPAKLVDINSARKAELMKLPGIGEAEADKIIAGRPFPTKARLVTNNIISIEV